MTPQHEPRVEIVQERDLDEMKAMLGRIDAAFTKYAPVLDRMLAALDRGSLPTSADPPGRRGIVDYVGQALVEGKFDGLISGLQEHMGLGAADVSRAPRRRRRSR